MEDSNVSGGSEDRPRTHYSQDAGRDKLAPPIRIGRYPVVGELGRGGMGVVYLAEDPAFPRQIAIKVLPSEFATEPASSSRLHREARLLATINHPNIATVYSLEEDDGHSFLTMEVVTGCTLAERIAAGPLPLAETMHVSRQVLAALETAHRKGIVHRDPKPSNIMVTEDGHVKVLDFGIAKDAGGEHSDSSASVTDPAASLGVMGTPGYASPEQLRGDPVDRRTDIWAFGCILYECLVGERAFPGGSCSEKIAASLEREPDWIAIPKETPEDIRVVMARCITKAPEERFQSVVDLHQQLRLAARQVEESSEEMARAPSRSHQPTSPPRANRNIRLGLVALAVVVLMFAVWQIARHVLLSRATYVVDGSTITGRAPLLGKLWSYNHESPVRVHTLTPWTDRRMVVYGLDVDGPDAGQIFVRDLTSGKLDWQAGPDLDEIAKVFGPERNGMGAFRCRDIRFVDLNGDGELELLAHYGHKLGSASGVSILTRGGTVIGSYYNLGLLYVIHIEDLDLDGKEEILLAGTNNVPAYQGATIILLDDQHCHGAAVDPLWHLDCSLGDSSLVRVVFPHFEQAYMDLLKTTRLVATYLTTTRNAEGDVEISATLGCDRAPHVVTLDQHLNPLGITMSDALAVETIEWPQEKREVFLSSTHSRNWLARHYRYGVLGSRKGDD
ncbi:MAG: serine/threonine protein kinase [Candidatus Eisenbacteria sp.]|nr:serine/threonine protein kinase [Candidatus Eisenbacteria bacterium]